MRCQVLEQKNIRLRAKEEEKKSILKFKPFNTDTALMAILKYLIPSLHKFHLSQALISPIQHLLVDNISASTRALTLRAQIKMLQQP
jgi:hypothetical protein